MWIWGDVFSAGIEPGTLRITNFLSAALSTTELWWRMNHRKSFRTLSRWYLLITMPSGLRFQKRFFIKHCRVEIIACPFVLFHNDRFFNVCCLFHQRFFAAYLLKLFLLPQRAHTTFVIRCDKPELTRWCLCSLYAGIQMSPDEVVGSRDGCCHSIAESTVDVPIRLFLANFQCSHRVVLVPFCIMYSLHLIVVWSLQAIWLPEWSLQLPSFLVFYVSKGRTGRSNTSLRTIYFHFAVTWSLPSTFDWCCFYYFLRNSLVALLEALFARTKCRVIDIALLCPSSHTWFQELSVINPSVLLQDLHLALIQFLISLVVCARHLYTTFHIVAWVCSFVSKHL